MRMVSSREVALATETPVSVEVGGGEKFGMTVGWRDLFSKESDWNLSVKLFHT